MRGKLVIAFLGTDGSGKTTVMSAVLPKIERMLGGRFIVHHLKPDWLPPLGRFRGVKHGADYVCVNPHASNPSGFLGSMVRLVYLTLDYVLGYWFKVRLAIQDERICGWAFDRYAYDMLIDPLRFRIKLPEFFVQMALAIIPKPDLVLCLGGDPEKIHARKPETSLEEVSRQVARLKGLCDAYEYMHWIDTTYTLEETVESVSKILKKKIVL